MTPTRIEPLPEPWSEEVRIHLEALMPPGIPPLALFRTVARNPRLLGKLRGANLLDRGSLERRDRELVILRTCARCGSEYEWGVHVMAFAERVGLSTERVAATVTAEADDPVWTDHERILIRLCDELHETSHLSDALWELLEAAFDDAQILELLLLAGFYHAISFITNGARIALEPGTPRFPHTHERRKRSC